MTGVITTANKSPVHVFSWTPSEAQGHGSYTVGFTATDSFSPPATDTNPMTITVNEVNTAPILAAIGNRSIDELALLTFTATATDADLPANTLTFSLGSGAPTGSAITSSGFFTWTPSEAQGPGTYSITIIVTDNGTPSLSDSETITVTVNEVNRMPVASYVFAFADSNGNGLLDLGETVSFDGSGSIDLDVPLDPITNYAWDFGDTGTATGSTVAHIYTAGGTFTVTLMVTDSHGATGSTSQTLEVGAPVAHANLNRWRASPQFHYQDLNKNPTQTLFAHAVNDGDVTVYVYVRFTLVSENGPSQSLTTQLVALVPGEGINGRQDPRFAVTFTPEPGGYAVTATLYYTTMAGLPIGDPGYAADAGSIKTFSFNTVRR